MLIPLLCWNYWFLWIFNAMLNSRGIEQMIILLGGFERITPQLGNIKNNTIFLIIYIKISSIINSYRIQLYHVGCVIFGMRCKNNLKKMREKTLSQTGMTCRFERILGHHTSQRIYGWNIFNMWHPSGSHDTHSPMRGTRADKFMVQLPHTPMNLFRSFRMRSEW